MTRSQTMASRLAGAVWGHLVGDAMGVPYEFRTPAQVGEVRWGERGSHHQPPGTWSDDGALMLALLDSLLTAGFDPEDQARRALAWYRAGAYTPDGDGVFDIGNATRDALEAYERGTPAEEAGPTHDRACGNGSLMRILPIALVERDVADEVVVAHAQRASAVTHGHPRPRVACAVYSLTIRRLLGGADPAAALADARRTLRSILETGQDGDGAALAALDHLEGWPGRSGAGSSWDAFWSAWEAVAGATSYRATIERAIRYGHDTDTTAAIAGGLAGARWGLDAIPADWRAGMRGAPIVEGLIERLQAHAGPASREGGA